MKRFVLSDAGTALTLGSIGGLIFGFTHASAGVAYLIAFAMLIIGTGITERLDRVRMWRKMHASDRRGAGSGRS